MFIVKHRFFEEAGDDGGAGGGAGGEGGTGGAGGGEGGGGAGSGTWYDSLPDDLKGFAANKAWPDEAAAVKSYRDLERMVRGGSPENLVRIPAMDAAPEDKEAFFNKLGRPEDPKGYELPEGMDWARDAFHKLGLNSDQAKGIVASMEELAAKKEDEDIEAYNVRQQQDTEALKTEWGAAYDKEIKIAARGARALGLSVDELDAIEDLKGYGAVMRMMNKVGHKIGEDTFEGGSGGQNSTVMTPAQAKDQIDSLKMDPDFRKKLQGGDPIAKAKWDQLHQMAFSAKAS